MFNLLEECKGAKRIGISGHVRPDGDCVGAVMGLYLYLKKALPEAVVEVFLEKPQEIFSYLTGFEEIVTDFPKEPPFDVFFVLDTAADRIGGAEPYFREAKKRINVDHHLRSHGSGDVNYLDSAAGSTSELVYDLIGEEHLDRDIALALYTGIIHDTGVFQYSCTTPETMRKGARLIGCGIEFPKIIQETFYQKTYLQAQIMGRALMESIRFMDGKCIVSAVDLKTMAFYSVGPKDLDGIVNQLKNIAGIECAIFMYQTDVQEYKVSLRSTERVNAARVAAFFGGGGHERAAGCTMRGTFHDCVNNLSLHIERELAEGESQTSL